MICMNNHKFIVSDIDGTLMPDTRQLPEELFGVIRQLTGMGVRFAIASGRQLRNMQQLFEPCVEDLLFIAHNGATIAEGHTLLTDSRISPAEVQRCIDYGRANGLSTMLYTPETVMIDDRSEVLHDFLSSHWVPFEVCDTLDDYTDNIAKLSLVNLKGIADGMREEVESLNVAAFLANRFMIDVTAVGTNKGVALQWLCNHYGLDLDDTYAFGDSENDLDMLTLAGHPYAVSNAPEKVKAVAQVVPSNNEGGVITTLKEIFNI